MNYLTNFSIYNFLQWTIGGSALCYLLFCIGLRLWQNRLIFVPSSEFTITPEQIGLVAEEIWISVNSEEQIHGWWVPNPNSDGVLLYFHGNSGNISDNLAHTRRFYQLGMSVLLIDYRGYGRSLGKFPNEQQVYEDARLAWNYLLDKGIEGKDIIIYGHSLGGAIAIDLATEHPQAAGLIIESSFTKMLDIVNEQGIYDLFPVGWILTHKFDSISKLPQVKMPVLLIHGTADQTVPSWMSEALYQVAPEPKQLLIVSGGDHSNVATVSGEEYLQTVSNFCQQLCLN